MSFLMGSRPPKAMRKKMAALKKKATIEKQNGKGFTRGRKS